METAFIRVHDNFYYNSNVWNFVAYEKITHKGNFDNLQCEKL